jgi:hypothetical protein
MRTTADHTECGASGLRHSRRGGFKSPSLSPRTYNLPTTLKLVSLLTRSISSLAQIPKLHPGRDQRGCWLLPLSSVNPDSLTRLLIVRRSYRQQLVRLPQARRARSAQASWKFPTPRSVLRRKPPKPKPKPGIVELETLLSAKHYLQEQIPLCCGHTPIETQTSAFGSRTKSFASLPIAI